MILPCRRICLAWLVGLLLLQTALGDVPTPPAQQYPTVQHATILKDTAHLLSSIGVTDLCHPTSNEFAPSFPKCSHRQNKNYTIGQHLPYRKLEQQDEQQEKTTSYYDYEDDYVEEEEVIVTEEPVSDWFYVYHASMTFFCVLTGAVASGLYIGLLSLDPLLLVIKMRAGLTEREKNQAAKILPLVKQRHRLIVTLLILNCVAAEAMPIFLQGLVPDALAIVFSVVFVLMFGEILPTAFFTGPNQIEIASRLAPLVALLMILLAPIAIPIARILDRVAAANGSQDDASEEHNNYCGTVYNRGELAALIRVQYEERMALKQRRKEFRQSSITSLTDLEKSDIATANDLRAFKADLIRSPENLIQSTGSLDSHDVMMVEGALNMRTKSAIDVYLSFHKVFCIPYDMILDETNIFTIYASGFSRVPVYLNNDRRQIKGILMTRQLMVVKRTEMCPPVSSMALHIPHCIAPETNLVDLVNLFQTGGTAVRIGHMALVCARPDIANDALRHGQAVPEEAGLMGIITLEDVLEALLQEQIYDEMDAAGRKSQHIYHEDDVIDRYGYEMGTIVEAMDSHSSYQLAEDDRTTII